MPTDSSQAKSRRPHHDRGLLLIAVYKLLNALLFIAIGIGAQRLLHRDIADQIELLARHLRFNPESHLVNFILEKASLINDPLLRRIGFVAFSYAGITLAEGIGLYLEKVWASSSLWPSPPPSCPSRSSKSFAASPGFAPVCSPSTRWSSSICCNWFSAMSAAEPKPEKSNRARCLGLASYTRDDTTGGGPVIEMRIYREQRSAIPISRLTCKPILSADNGPPVAV